MGPESSVQKQLCEQFNEYIDRKREIYNSMFRPAFQEFSIIRNVGACLLVHGARTLASLVFHSTHVPDGSHVVFDLIIRSSGGGVVTMD